MSARLARADGPAAGDHLLPTYKRRDVVFARGEGAWLEATDGRRFLDFGSGVAVNALGHAHPRLVAALTAQAGALWHVSNLFRIDGQERLAERLCAASFADRVFFANSGAEAMEFNDEVRVVAQTSFTDAVGGILIDGTLVSSPFVLNVIGDPRTLQGAMSFVQGPTDQLEHDGATVEVTPLAALDIDAVRPPTRAEYAQPTTAQ